MTEDHKDREAEPPPSAEEIFYECLERPPDARAGYLAESCGDDRRLRAEVESLLTAHQQGQRVFQAPLTETSPDVRAAGLEEETLEGTTVGRYRLLERVGEGGMGIVFRAEQDEPIRRQVAVKVVRLGMDTENVIARFEMERQALAILDHPGVAKVFDAGATERGRPYFVMEYVDGQPITRYCDLHRLDTTQRLDLFARVCEAVHHAHQRGIIHRDLKPSNILVGTRDGKPAAKVIDFGVAKATDRRLAEKTLFTERGQLIGTPEYMSPEQADPARADIDTTTDVYSLGVLLYELLTGALPFDTRELREQGWDAIQRFIQEKTPRRPSTRISSLGDGAAETAARRRSSVRALLRELQGELDWIVLKAMEKERARRYESAAALAADIERYLRKEPVLAGPPGASYRLRKFARRNRVAVTAGALVLLALVIGTIGTTLGMFRARRAETRLRVEAERASREAETARQVSEFLTDIFTVSDPSESRGNTITAREILDRGAEQIRGELAERPLVQARLLDTMGRVYRRIGLYEEARSLLEEAVRIREATPDGIDAELGASLSELGALLVTMGDNEAARPALERALELTERATGASSEQASIVLDRLGSLYNSIGDREAALAVKRKALQIAIDREGPDSQAAAELGFNVGVSLIRLARNEEGRAILEDVVPRLEEILGADHPDIPILLTGLASARRRTGDPLGAVELHLRSVALAEKVLGPDHLDVGLGNNNLGFLLIDLGRLDEAEERLSRAKEIFEKAVGAEHPHIANVLGGLGLARLQAGDYATARAHLDESRAVWTRTLGPDNPRAFGVMRDAARLERLDGNLSRAEIVIDSALEMLARGAGAAPDLKSDARLARATILAEQGRDAEADADYEAAAAAAEEAWNRTGTLFARAEYQVARANRGRALELLQEAVDGGYASARILIDPELDELRGDPAFDEIAAAVSARISP